MLLGTDLERLGGALQNVQLGHYQSFCKPEEVVFCSFAIMVKGKSVQEYSLFMEMVQ